MFPIGSEWRKWDLHVHTPASLVHQYPGPDPWERFLEGLAALPPEVGVVGINDYLFIDGYRRVRQEFESKRFPNLLAILPVVELRIDQLVGTEGHLNKINFHVIFDPDVGADAIEAQFINGLSADFRLDPSRVDVSWSGFPSSENLAGLGSAIRATIPDDHQDRYPESDMVLGFNNLVLTLDQVRQRLKQPVFDGRFITAVGKTEWDSLRWTDHSIARKKDVINGAEAIFIAAESSVAYDRARRKLLDAEVNSRLLDCSDAHCLQDASSKDRLGNSFTWISADPTLPGLVHALTEFEERVFVGDLPPKLAAVTKRPSDHVRSIRIQKRPGATVPHAYFSLSLDLNSGFVAVIGNKGKGKSALLDVLGLACNSANEPHFTFLSAERFRNPIGNPAASYEAVVEWHSGERVTVQLADPGDATAPERATYLPQKLIDEICSADPGEPAERFAKELKSVLFAHVPPADRLGAADLDELVHARTLATEERLAVLRSELTTINREIVDLERRSAPAHRKSLEGRLSLLETKVADLDRQAPPVPKPPEIADDPLFVSLRAKLEELRQEQVLLEAEADQLAEEDSRVAVELDSADQLRTAIDTLRHQFESFQATNSSRATALGVDLSSLVQLVIEDSALTQATEKRRGRRSEIATRLSGEVADSIPARRAALAASIREAEAKLDQPMREYTKALATHESWQSSRRELLEGTPEAEGIEQVKEALAFIDNAPAQLQQLKQLRRQTVANVHDALRAVIAVYEDLYGPARQFIAQHELATKAQLEFGAAIRERDLEPRFWELHRRNVVGTFLGADEGATVLHGMIEGTDFNSVEDVIRFTDSLDAAVHQDQRADPPTDVNVERAIRSAHTVEELYDLIFGLTFLEPYYVLQYSGTPVDQLSPGEKGTILLMFYLLVDPSSRPLILDQPDENLDNQTIMELLVPAVKEARHRRQLIVVTHNPNVAVVADADQVVGATFHDGLFEYVGGAIEAPGTNARVVDVLEGTWPAFENRELKYQEPADA